MHGVGIISWLLVSIQRRQNTVTAALSPRAPTLHSIEPWTVAYSRWGFSISAWVSLLIASMNVLAVPREKCKGIAFINVLTARFTPFNGRD